MKPMPHRGIPAFHAMNASLLVVILAVAAAGLPARAQSHAVPASSLPPVAPATSTSAVPAVLVPGPSRPFTTPRLQLNNPNREALEAPFRTPAGPADVPPALLRSTHSSFSLRSAFDAINPFAPIPPELRKVRYQHEIHRPVDHGYPRSLRDPLSPGIPRSFQDPITHEASLRLW